MKKTIIIILFILFQANRMFAAGSLVEFYGSLDSLYYKSYTVKSVSELDTIDKFNERYRSFTNSLEDTDIGIITFGVPDIIVTFDSMSESQIDSSIRILYRNSYSQEIIGINIKNSPIKKIPESFKLCDNLYGINFIKCDSISSFTDFNTTARIFAVTFDNCRIEKLPDGIENLLSYVRLSLGFPVDFSGFDLDQELKKFEKRNNIFDMAIVYAKCDKFPETIFNLKALQTLIFISKGIEDYPDRFDSLQNLTGLYLSARSKIESINEEICAFKIINTEENSFLWEQDGFPVGFYKFIYDNSNFFLHPSNKIAENDYLSNNTILFDQSEIDSVSFIFQKRVAIVSRNEREGFINIKFPDLKDEDSAQIKIFIDEFKPSLFEIKVVQDEYLIDLRDIETCFLEIEINGEKINKLFHQKI